MRVAPTAARPSSVTHFVSLFPPAPLMGAGSTKSLKETSTSPYPPYPLFPMNENRKKIPATTIDVLRAVSAERVAVMLGIEVRQHKCRCPFHDDSHPSMSFTHRHNTWRCFACGAHGSAIDLVMRYSSLSFPDACQWIADRTGVTIDSPSASCGVRRHTRRLLPNPYRLPPSVYPGGDSQRGDAASAAIDDLTSAIRRHNGDAMLPPVAIPFFRSASNGAAGQGDDDIRHQEKEGGSTEPWWSVDSEFCHALIGRSVMTDEQMRHAAETYCLGATSDGGVVFWQIDERRRAREGKVMHFGGDCHRRHDRTPYSVTWLLKHRCRMLPEDYAAVPCLFGEHLLAEAGDAVVAVVEAEKTAVICSELLPATGDGRRVVWLASGGLSALSVQGMMPLSGRSDIVFPDKDSDGEAYRKWVEVAKAFYEKTGTAAAVSRLLEDGASEEQRRRKIDIADILMP